jgi:hypothetical protein
MFTGSTTSTYFDAGQPTPAGCHDCKNQIHGCWRGGQRPVEIDPASEVGTMMAELRRRIDPADLVGKGIAAQPDITVRSGVVVGDLDGLRHYLRSLNPFEITFGRRKMRPSMVSERTRL